MTHYEVDVRAAATLAAACRDGPVSQSVLLRVVVAMERSGDDR